MNLPAQDGGGSTDTTELTHVELRGTADSTEQRPRYTLEFGEALHGSEQLERQESKDETGAQGMVNLASDKYAGTGDVTVTHEGAPEGYESAPIEVFIENEKVATLEAGQSYPKGAGGGLLGGALGLIPGILPGIGPLSSGMTTALGILLVLAIAGTVLGG